MFRNHFFLRILQNYSSDDGNRAKAELVISFSILSILICLVYFIIHPAFNFHVPRVLYIAHSVGLLGIIYLLYLSLSLFFVANLMIFIFWISFVFAVGYSGGVYSPILPWFALMPIMAHILIHQYAARWWMFLSFISIVFFNFYFVDISPLHDPLGDYRSLFSSLGLVLLIYLFSDIFNNTKQRLLNDLRMSNSELAGQKEEVITQNDELTHQRDEILSQNKFIQSQNELLQRQNAEIERVNGLLRGHVEEIFKRNETLGRYWRALLEISKDKSVNFGDFDESLRHIIKTVALSLNTHRVSVWRFNDERNSIQCKVIYEAKEDRYLIEEELLGKDFPRYFEALRSEEVIPADDASVNNYTFEFRKNYLEPKHIVSMMDTPYFIDGKLGGVLCCEHKDEPRHWTPEDILFAQSLSDIITLSFRASQRREYEQRLRMKQKEVELINLSLEAEVIQRTKELQEQNRQLTEYAFINSHLLRGPLMRILGLVNLMDYSEMKKKETELINHLKASTEELDAIVKKITETIEPREFNDSGQQNN